MEGVPVYVEKLYRPTMQWYDGKTLTSRSDGLVYNAIFSEFMVAAVRATATVQNQAVIGHWSIPLE